MDGEMDGEKEEGKSRQSKNSVTYQWPNSFTDVLLPCHFLLSTVHFFPVFHRLNLTSTYFSVFEIPPTSRSLFCHDRSIPVKSSISNTTQLYKGGLCGLVKLFLRERCYAPLNCHKLSVPIMRGVGKRNSRILECF